MAFPGSHLLFSFLRSRRNDPFSYSRTSHVPQLGNVSPFSTMPNMSPMPNISPIPNIFCSRNSVASEPKYRFPVSETGLSKFRVPVSENSTSLSESDVTPAPACSKFNENDIFSHSMRPQRVAGFYGRALPEHLIDFSSTMGKRLFGESLNNGHMESYFKLAGQYFAQSDVAFCGLAVLCMVLNSLSIDPARIWKSPWRWYSEEMMGCCTPLDQVRKKGIDFDKFKCLATCKGATVKAIRYNESTLESFREDIKRVTSSTSEFMVACYNRKHVGQTGTGHFAPVGGYHEPSDRVLVLDVARFKYPSHWVEVPLLFGAMKDIDPATEKSRGYFLLGGMTQQTPNAKLNDRPEMI